MSTESHNWSKTQHRIWRYNSCLFFRPKIAPFPQKSCLFPLSLSSQLLSGRSGFTFNTNRNSKIYRVFSDRERRGENEESIYGQKSSKRAVAGNDENGRRETERERGRLSTIARSIPHPCLATATTTYKLGAGNNTGQGNVFLASLGKNLLSGNENA